MSSDNNEIHKYLPLCTSKRTHICFYFWELSKSIIYILISLSTGCETTFQYNLLGGLAGFLISWNLAVRFAPVVAIVVFSWKRLYNLRGLGIVNYCGRRQMAVFQVQKVIPSLFLNLGGFVRGAPFRDFLCVKQQVWVKTNGTELYTCITQSRGIRYTQGRFLCCWYHEI